MSILATQAHPATAVEYYQQKGFNPVPIALENAEEWDTQIAKRVNLYQRHLGIPPALLNGRSVLEFGCNSGENALVLAFFGAKLTLVEPNEQVLPRLKSLFMKYGLLEQITALVQTGIEGFETDERYDVVVAEGFLDGLPDRDDMVRKIAELLKLKGVGVISFDDRIGSLLESVRRLILLRTLQLSGIEDAYSKEALAIAKRLFLSDFTRLNSSRPFEAWWMDSLMHPLIFGENRWSYEELLPLIEAAGCEFYSSSPKWDVSDHRSWYKNVSDPFSRHQTILMNLRKNFLYILTGMPSDKDLPPVPDSVVDAVAELVCANYAFGNSARQQPIDAISYPLLLSDYLNQTNDSRYVAFDRELSALYEAIRSDDVERIISSYQKTRQLRRQWGCPYHYLSFCKRQR